MTPNELLSSEKRYDHFFHGFVHKDVTYCFFVVSEEELPETIFAFNLAIRQHMIFAVALQRHVEQYGNLKTIMRDFQCMQHAPKKNFVVSKVCDHLTHILIDF